MKSIEGGKDSQMESRGDLNAQAGGSRCSTKRYTQENV